MLACRSVHRPKHVVRWFFPTYHTWHASTQPAVGAAKRHSQNAYLTAMFGQYIGAISTTKYGFNLRQNSPLNIENNTVYSGWIRVSVAHALIGPQSLKLPHFWNDIRWFPPLLFHYIPLHDWKRAGETVLNATVPTSPQDEHIQKYIPDKNLIMLCVLYVIQVLRLIYNINGPFY